MMTGTLKKSGDNYIITVSRDEVERLGLREGQVITVEVLSFEEAPHPAKDVQQAFEASWDRNQEGYRYLAGR
jgi:hypothetical protein